MKKVKLSEESYNKLKDALIKYNNPKVSVNEISYGTVDRAYRRSEDIFFKVKSEFEDFYNALTDALYNVQYESDEGEQTSNPYLNKIRKYADAIYDILNQKSNQKDKFFDATTNMVDHDKFWKSDDGLENDIDDMDLNYLQTKYSK